jgi:site-specific recombinase
MREAIAHQRRLILTLGAPRAQRFAAWVEDHLAAVVGNVTLAQLLGMTPVVAGFFGLPLNTRHVTLSTASLTADMVTLGWSALGGGPFWLAVAGILVIGLLNVGVAFGCALALAMRAREVPTRVRRIVFRQVWKRFSASPASFFFSVPPEPGPDVADEEASAKLENERRHKGR